jgi:nitrous oxidase accessory protein NosD
MTTYYIDPTRSSNGDGSFATPRNIFPTSIAYGDIVLFKEQTVYNGTWTLPTPSGTGSSTNIVLLGTYDATTGNRTISKIKQAQIKVTSSSTDAILISAVSYITISSLHCVGGNTYPYAGVRALNSSYITVEYCTIENISGLNGGYGLRFDNATGSGSAHSNWVIKNNEIKNITGNAGIVCGWSLNSGEYVSNITIKDNLIYNLKYAPTHNAYGILVQCRASPVYTDKAGLCAKGVQILNNTIKGAPAYAINVRGVNSSATSQSNIISGNLVLNTGNGLVDCHCIWLGACYNFIVSENKVDKSNALVGGTTGSGVGIFIDKPVDELDGCEDILVTRNKITETGLGDTNNIELGGAGIAVLNSRRVTVSYNFVQYCRNGIIIWGGSTSGNKSANVSVHNNTIAHNDGPGIYICKIADLVTVKNNLCYKNTTGFYIENSGTAVITNYTETYNLVWECTNKWTGGNAPTVASPTITTRTPDASNLETDPEITTTFNIKNTGSAYAAGTFINYGKSLNGQSKNPPSIGAYEYLSIRGTR